MNTPTMDAKSALTLLSGAAKSNSNLPENLKVSGTLRLENLKELQSLPSGLQASKLVIKNCPQLTALPAGLTCFDLQIENTPIQTLPDDICVQRKLILENCFDLQCLPTGLNVGVLQLRHCGALLALPEQLQCDFLTIDACAQLHQWPSTWKNPPHALVIRELLYLHTLPSYFTKLSYLDVSGCQNLQQLPEHLNIIGWLDVADTGLTGLPEHLKQVVLRWRGVPIDYCTAFHPETLTADDVLSERNSEVRRVKMERMNPARFIADTQAKIVDEDTDPGGLRQLLRIDWSSNNHDEALVYLHVRCPSTGRQYYLRVPPDTRSCHAGAAWLAGFDNPEDYQPVIET